MAWRKAYYLPLAHTLSRLSHPTPRPCENQADRFCKKPSLLLIRACGLLRCTHTHTHTYLSGVQGVFFSLTPPFFKKYFLHTQMHRGPRSFPAFLYVSPLLTRGTKQVISARVKSSIRTVLSVDSQSASPLRRRQDASRCW